MKAFSEEHIARISKNYESDPDHRKPEIFWIATLPEYSTLRNQISHWVETYIPNSSRGELVNKLGLKEHFRATYNELLIAHKLTLLEYTITYEPKLGNSKTPDWFITNQDGSMRFYVEVFSPQLPGEVIKVDGLWKELSARIESKKLGYGISIKAGRKCLPPDSQRAKRMANMIEIWLTTERPSIRDCICIHHETLETIANELKCFWEGVCFKVIESGLKLDSSWCTPPVKVHTVANRSLKRQVKEKARKYVEELKVTQMPYVICIVPSKPWFTTHDIEEVLYGERESILVTMADGRSELLWHPKNNGLFSNYMTGNQVLSAVVWLQELHGWSLETNEDLYEPIKVYHNPRALHRLPDGALRFDQI